jgi:hypothetical protein
MSDTALNQTVLPIRTVITWNVFFVFLYLYRVVFSILGHLVVMRLTSIGDTETYQSEGLSKTLLKIQTKDIGDLLQLGDFQLSTLITDWLGSQFFDLLGGNPIMINIAFQTITFVGLVYFILSVPLRSRKILAGLLMLPSFTLWTSIASKECIVTFCVAIISGYLVRQYTSNVRLNVIHVFSIGLLYIFKPHYLIPIAYAWSIQYFGRIVKQKEVLAYLGLFLSLIGLVVFNEKISELSFHVQWTFETVADVRSTRRHSFFVDEFDVFFKMPEGFYRSFMGPTLDEIMTSPLHLMTFLESLVLLSVLTLALLARLKDMPIYNFIVSLGITFWVLFPNYPFGVMNAGSAIRYRSGWIILIFLAIAVLSSREIFQVWKNQKVLTGGRSLTGNVPAE